MKTIYAAAKSSLPHAMSSLDIAIVTGAFTLAAAILGFVGTGLIQARALRREDRAQYDRLVREALSAAEDVSDAVHLFAANWGVVRFSDVLIRLVKIFTAEPEIWIEAVNDSKSYSPKALRMMLLTMNRGISVWDVMDSHDSRYLQIVFPTLQRLRAALIPLRIGKDPVIAESAEKLTAAAESWASKARLTPRRYEPAHEEWARAFTDFRTAAFARLNSQPRAERT